MACGGVRTGWRSLVGPSVLARCVIVELFTDGRPPFNLSQLLEYRNGQYKNDEVIQKIPDKHIRVGRGGLHPGMAGGMWLLYIWACWRLSPV